MGRRCLPVAYLEADGGRGPACGKMRGVACTCPVACRPTGCPTCSMSGGRVATGEVRTKGPRRMEKVSLGENRGSFSFNAPWNDGTKCGQTQIRLHGGWLLKAGVCAMTLVQHESRNVWIMMLKPSLTRLLFTVYWLPVLPWGLRDSNVLFESRSGMVWYWQADQPRSKPCEPWNQVIPGEPKSGKNK